MNSGVKIKYLTSVMFGHAKAKDVVREMLKTTEGLAIPLKLMLSLEMDGPTLKMSLLNSLNQITNHVVQFMFTTIIS